jgi:hypothetical protein
MIISELRIVSFWLNKNSSTNMLNKNKRIRRKGQVKISLLGEYLYRHKFMSTCSISETILPNPKIGNPKSTNFSS